MDEHQEMKHKQQKKADTERVCMLYESVYEDQGQVKGFSGNKNKVREARD